MEETHSQIVCDGSVVWLTALLIRPLLDAIRHDLGTDSRIFRTLSSCVFRAMYNAPSTQAHSRLRVDAGVTGQGQCHAPAHSCIAQGSRICREK